MKDAFIGTSNSVDAATLKETILRCVGEAGWQCLMWPHAIELLSVTKAHQDFESCMEGRAFNQVCELRWKRKRNRRSETVGYELLLLSSRTEGNDDFIKDLGDTLEPETSALFVLVRKATPDKVIAELGPFNGKVLKTSLSQTDENALKAALEKAQAVEV